MTTHTPDTPAGFVPLRVAARHLGVPIVWLEAQAEAGNVPVLKLGNNRVLAHIEAVKQTLLAQHCGHGQNLDDVMLPDEQPTEHLGVPAGKTWARRGFAALKNLIAAEADE